MILMRLRYFKFSLKLLLGVVLTIGVPLGLWASRWASHSAQVQALERLATPPTRLFETRHGGMEVPTVDAEWKLNHPQWIAQWYPAGSLEDVHRLYIHNPALEDKEYEALGKFPMLESLSINSRKFTGKALRKIGRATGLKRLEIHAPNMLGGELAYLSNLHELEELELYAGKVSAKDLTAIDPHALPELQKVVLSTKQISEASVQWLQGFRSLRSLKLYGDSPDEACKLIEGLKQLESFEVRGPVSDIGLASISQLQNLSDLTLHSAVATAAGTKYLQRLTRLQSLWLEQCDSLDDEAVCEISQISPLRDVILFSVPVTDKSLACFQGMKVLETLELHGTEITPARMAAFRNANPGVHVEYSK